MTSRTQQARASANNSPPANGSLLPGQIYLEMGTPYRLWGGVPVSINPNGVKLILDADVAALLASGTLSTLTVTGPKVNMAQLPVSNGTATDLAAKGLVTGDLYNNGGVVCIAP